MSRCFPFPPPGYERKAGADNVDLLKQEKHKEKKHRKEKRDREKREGKDKKEKDRGDEKHRDKKEKKNKRRDKKDKEKEKEKDRSSTSYEKKQPVQTGYINEEKVLDQKGTPTLPALQTGEKSIQKEKDKFKTSIADIKKPSVTLGHNGERVISTNHVAGVSDAKCVQELAKRLKTDQCSGSGQASADPDHRKNYGKDQLLGKAAIAGLDCKERIKDRRHNNEHMLDVSVNKEKSKLNGTVKVQGFGEDPGQKKLQEIPKPSEVNAKKMEWREIITGREGGDMQGDKLKDKYIDKSQGKVKESRKKEERVKEKSERKHIDQEKLKAGIKNGVVGSPHLKSLQSVKETNRTVVAEGNLKRKESETNGFLLGDEVRANKLQKQAQGVVQVPLENGMEPLEISTKISPPRPEPTNNVKVNREEKKINGVKGAEHPSPISPLHPPLSAAQAELLLAAEASVRPPHPDSKFLGEILKVPKLDELPDLDDDQGWLFSSNKEEFKKSNGGRQTVLEGTPEVVWGESIHIESADIYALPYVFPY